MDVPYLSVAKERKRREIDPVQDILLRCREQTDGLRGSEAEVFQKQIRELTDFVTSTGNLMDRVASSQLSKLFGAPLGFGLPQPSSLLEFGAWLLRTETELVIKSRRVVPRRLLEEGTEFVYDRFEEMVGEREEKVSP